MEATKTFAIGSVVKIVGCSVCPNVVGRTATILSENDQGQFSLKFGRGRPQKDRPKFFDVNDLVLTSEA